MVDKQSYLMAIDLLTFHLGLSEEQAKERLGLGDEEKEKYQQDHIKERWNETNY